MLLIMLSAGCRKETATPPVVTLPLMNYVDLHDRQIKFNQSLSVDVNGDGSKDVYFFTELLGDPILKRDYRQYLVASSFYTSLPVNNNEQIPLLSKEAPISLTAHTGYEWYNGSNIVLAQKVISETGPDWWDGEWKNAAHKYVPIQVAKDSLMYYGWVEISFDTQAENIIAHKAAVCKEAGKEVKAGL
ncbi:MAG: hypothetical protein JWQ09_1585 [Segetibacter sp.]|nr:hypothetical protein [Segetibacter sp.]